MARRENLSGPLLASAVRTATTNTADQTNVVGQGVALTLNVTAEAGGVETLSLKVQGKDPASGNYFDIVDFGVVYDSATAAPTITRTGIMHPGIVMADLVGIAGNGSIGRSAPLPRTWRAVVTHSAAGSWTYSLSAAVLI